MTLDFFTEKEFERCSPSCSKSDMNVNFLSRLNYARFVADVPFVLNSAFRSSEYDKSKGRSGTGYHTQGRAVDIRCTSSRDRALIVWSCLNAGLSCGISKTFVHVDDRPNQITFLY